ncbi:serine endoprotease DegP [Enterobacter hormaechei]|jgi:serine protease Do|uniref:serine endoprotease DegP n=1 Tax=Enterobacter cloacae complex TaxID=354276 RepID=UPI000735A5E0|nr:MULTISPECIES: serine endoprotease DegP [Enterobacter cloacae complex]EKY3887483.1 serine endoprotease DegP [Enterobacter hormaechei]EKY3935683.1 serine endoprotease DegP [Enterobacter hormaechei]EKY4151211.1 serine endoprotease DegP [Enterobacter hormaechei subsp. steigerwaltii]EMD2741945.1 serine endoprotease DegP [Enterobacter hormaechei]KTG94025.1 serine endoprotease [Enterobacter hormaechei subsp. steigerwaltii]
MKKTTLAMSALALSLGLALSPLAMAAETASSAATAQQIPSLAPMLEKVMPSVVSINVEGSTTVNTPRMPRNFQQFFGDNSPFCQDGSPFQSSPFCQGGGAGDDGQGGGQQQKFMALGSGVIIDAAKGYVVTNNHVVDNANTIKVQMSDGRKFDAKVVGKDPRSDIALIQIQDPKNLTAIKLADSDALRVGDYTVAIGNPFGLGETVTSGIVSALGRSGLNAENYENFIQTDAAINRGNSGGALVNLNGELIGINTAILAPDGGNIGIGFAIPSNMVKNLTAQMVQYGQVKRGELGIMGTELNSELAKAMKVDAQRGAFVSQVMPNSSAAKAGIKAGDVITSLNGKPISSFAALRAEVGSMPIGSKVTLGLLREGKPVNVSLELQQSSQNQVDSSTIFSGIEGAEMSNKGADKGVVVNNVKANSPAARIGLKKGDVIMGANQQPVKNIAELRKILDSKPSVLALNIQRGDTSIYLLMQ